MDKSNNLNDQKNINLFFLKQLTKINDLYVLHLCLDTISKISENLFFLKNLSLIDNLNAIHSILKVIAFYPEKKWNEGLCESQIKSKLWIVEELKNLNLNFNLVYYVGSWYNILALLLSEYLNIPKVKSFDKDPSVLNVSDDIVYHRLINDFSYKTTIKDMFDINYENHIYTTIRYRKDGTTKQVDIFDESADLIINCSCEHIDYKKWLELIPKNKFLVLQNNNAYNYPDHINCEKNLKNFIKKCNLSEIFYKGTLKLKSYDRFMIIGKK